MTDYMMLNFIDPELNWNMLMVPIAVILVVEYILMRAIVYTSKPEITRQVVNSVVLAYTCEVLHLL